MPTPGTSNVDARSSEEGRALDSSRDGFFATIDLFLARIASIFANDLSTAKLPESKYGAFLQGQLHLVRPQWIPGDWPYAGAEATAGSRCARSAI